MMLHHPCYRLALPVVLSLLTTILPAVRAGTDIVPQSPDLTHIVRDINAINIERTVRKLASFGTRNTLSTQEDEAHGIGAARDWLAEQFRSLQTASDNRLRVELQTFVQPVAPRIPHPVRLTNIVATLPGDSPEASKRILIVSGHYDSICTDPTDAIHDAPGANDDASGVAAVLEMARVLSRYHFHATILFLCVAGEEQGLLGSTYFAEQAKAQNLQIESMFTNDIIGSSLGGNSIRNAHTVRVFSEGIPSNESEAEARQRRSIGGENDGPSRQMARFIKETGERYVPGMKVTLVSRRDRYLRGGDHIPFNERGYAAVRFTEPNEDYHHQHQNVRTENGILYGDLPEFVDFSYVAQVTRINAVCLSVLALAPAPPHNAGIVTRRLTTDTDLRWDANPEPDLAGYEIVWRATTEANWTHSRAVGNVTTYTFQGLSKDDYLFGVRAIDKQGRRSPVAYPRPVR